MAIRLPPDLLSHASASGGLVKSGRSTAALVTRVDCARTAAPNAANVAVASRPYRHVVAGDSGNHPVKPRTHNMSNVRARARVFRAAGRPLVHVGTAPTTQARPSRYARPPTAATTMADTVGFVLLHVACVAVLVVGVSIQAMVIAAVTYALRCFGVAAGFHRYFSHR